MSEQNIEVTLRRNPVTYKIDVARNPSTEINLGWWGKTGPAGADGADGAGGEDYSALDTTVGLNTLAIEALDTTVGLNTLAIEALGSIDGTHNTLAGLTEDDHPQYLPINGDRAMTADLDMSNNSLTNVSDLYIDDNTYITKDDDGNITFTDNVTGTLALAEMHCPPLVDINNTDTTTQTNTVDGIGGTKLLIKWIEVETNSPDWEFYTYTKNDFSTREIELISGKVGDYKIEWDYPYENGDNTTHFNYKFVNNVEDSWYKSGDTTTNLTNYNVHNVRILGYKLR